MLEYPDEFETSTFPAGKRIAVARAMSIAIMVVFMLIVLACVFLLWVQKSAHVHPFLVSINNITGQWSIVGHQHTDIKEFTTAQTLQESVVGKFMRYRFLITDNSAFNTMLWQECDRSIDCNPSNKTDWESNICAFYCLSGDDEYNEFVANIVPGYQERMGMGETWSLDMSSLQMTPIGGFAEKGGVWQVRATINSNMFGPINILAYVNVGQNMGAYPETLGYYVSDFNAYKIN